MRRAVVIERGFVVLYSLKGIYFFEGQHRKQHGCYFDSLAGKNYPQKVPRQSSPEKWKNPLFDPGLARKLCICCHNRTEPFPYRNIASIICGMHIGLHGWQCQPPRNVNVLLAGIKLMDTEYDKCGSAYAFGEVNSWNQELLIYN